MSSLDSDVTGDPDSPIRVVVTPSQSAYFAGETLSVTITFTNTLTRTSEGEAGPASKLTPRSARTHKRASHSVSSAPIARPPTSPAGLYKPKTPTTGIPGSPTTRQDSLALASDGTPLQRRRLIGRKVGSVPDLVEQRRKKMLAKSLSLTIGLHEGQEDIEDRLNEEEKQIIKSASYTQRSFTADAHLLPPSSPRVSSPLARSETLPLPSKHPHARKQSVTDGTHFPYPPPPTINGSDISTSPTSPTSTASTTSTSNTLAFVTSPTSGPPTPSASTSSYSLSLDPIAEVSPVVPAYPYLSPSAPASASRIGPALSSPSIAIEAPSPPSVPAEQPIFPRSKTRQTHRPPNIGLGKPSSHMFLDLDKSQAELILYSYAQLKGTVTLTPIPSNHVPSSSSAKSVASPRTPVQSVLPPYAPSPHLSPPPPLPLSAAQIEQQKALNLASLRQALLKGSATAVGGGSMDITSRTHSRTPSAGGAASLGGGLGSGSWGSFGAASPGPSAVPAYGPPSAKSPLGTIHSGSTDGPDLPLSARRPHSRASSLSSGFLSIFGSPFGLGGDAAPMSAPAVTHPNNLAASVSAPNVSVYGQQRPNRNRTASASVVPSSSSGWPSASSPSLIHSGPASAGLGSFTSFSALSSPGIGGPPSGTRLGLGLGWPLASSAEEVDPELPLPTFEAQSTMLAVDISLEPGESRSYDYSILLPSNLPPTFRGRTFRFAYELVVGICRAGTTNNFSMSGRSVGPAGSVSKVMKVPIRVYTNVVVGRPPIPYDLLWPVNKRRPTPALGHRRGGKPSSGRGSGDNDDLYVGKVVELSPGAFKKVLQSKHDLRITVSDSTSSLSGSINDTGSLMELKDYAKRLVAELPESTTETEAGLSSYVPASELALTSNPNDGHNGISSKPLSPLFEEDSVDEVEKRRVNGNSGGGTTTTAELAFKEKERVAKMRQREESDDPILVGGCGEAVEILTRNPKKVSYDVNKDGVKVAVLTFIKSAFRLGETIQGVVELNERQGRARVVQLSAHLETHESLPYSISTTPNTTTATRQLKRVHVEHHSSFVLSTLRTTFALDIPSDASPAFQLKVGDESFPDVSDDKKHKLEGGLEWKVRLCLLVAVAKETADVGTEDVKFKSLVRDGPRGEWGSAWKAPPSAAPCEKPPSPQSHPKHTGEQQQNPGVVKSWTSFIAASILGTAEEGDDLSGDRLDDEGGDSTNSYDGIKSDRAGGVGIGVNFSGGKEELWQEVKLETVECEVPVRVWPGNTAFKPVDVVFDV